MNRVYYVNQELLNQVNIMARENRGLCAFIDASIGQLNTYSPSMKYLKEYWLYYYIKNDFNTIISSLQGKSIEEDFLGFPQVRCTLRHMIEAYLDMLNLVYDPEYIEVIKFSANEPNAVHKTKYKNYMYKNTFNNKSRAMIAKDVNNVDCRYYLDMAIECNKYVHPDVFIDVCDDTDSNIQLLQRLLDVSIEILINAYRLISWKIAGVEQIPLTCCDHSSAENCKICMENEIRNIYCIINEALVYETDYCLNYRYDM